jgi:mRNA degradation ribonuclease J1/J2
VHASGHMSKDQLIEMVKEIQPKQAFPVHTENAELFKKFMGSACSQVSLVEKGVEYQL